MPSPSDQPGFDASTFAGLVEGLVADGAPRLFAVVQEYGQRVDGRIAAWGMAFDDHAEVVSVEHDQRWGLPDAQSALRMLDHGDDIRAHLVWVEPGGQEP